MSVSFQRVVYPGSEAQCVLRPKGYTVHRPEMPTRRGALGMSYYENTSVCCEHGPPCLGHMAYHAFSGTVLIPSHIQTGKPYPDRKCACLMSLTDGTGT